VARNAWFGVALLALTAVAACGGEVVEAKAAQAAQAQLTRVRARTDSIKQAREARMAAAADSAAPAEAAAADSTAQSSLAATAGTVPGQSAALAVKPAAVKPAVVKPAADSVKPAADSLDQEAEAALADSVQRAREIDVLRETFAYAGGTRDPFNSLINKDKSGPEIGDLDLVGVYLDLRSPSNNIVVLREKGANGRRHKMRVGDQLGRSRLTQIRARDAVFTIQDFGFDRQETLSLRKQEVETP
jgi:hypothetical protein